MISPQLYWVMTGDDFTLDINNPKEPKFCAWVIILTPKYQNIFRSFGFVQFEDCKAD
jgi:hypothetical protein